MMENILRLADVWECRSKCAWRGQMINCIKCKKELPEGSVYCCYCGKKQNCAHETHYRRNRGNGMGTAYKRGKTWTAQWRVMVDAAGRPLESPISRTKGGFATKREALDYIPTLAETAAPTEWLTLRQLYDRWKPTHKASHSTMNCYNAGINHLQALWECLFCDITIDDWQRCIDQCSQGKRTRQNMKTIIGLLYKFALPRGQTKTPLNLAEYLIIRSSECPPTLDKPGLPLNALEKIRQAAANGDRIAEMVYAQCYLGFRPTGFLQLKVSNYDPVEKTIRGGTKTAAGKNRLVTISPKIQHIFDKYTAGKTSGLIFTDLDGAPIALKQYRKRFYDLLDRLDIDNPIRSDGSHTYSPHSCRHTFATLMKTIPAPDKDKLALIGHTKIEMLQYYQDTPLEDLRRITDNL